MTDKHEGEAGATGSHKTGPRFSWMTGEEAIKLVFTFVMAAVGGLLGAGYMVGVQFTTVDNRIAANTEVGKANKQSIAAMGGDMDLLKADVGQIKIDISEQTNKLSGIFSRQYGNLKDKVDERFDELEKIAARADERMQWLQDEQRKELRRAPAWWRDERLRKKP